MTSDWRDPADPENAAINARFKQKNRKVLEKIRKARA
jgi:hypothetical protein